MMNHASPITERENEVHNFDDANEEPFRSNMCFCFSRSCFGKNRGYDGETNGLLGDERETWLRETWLRERLRKLREVSELLAGPKWKNFIRKISKHFNRRKMRKGQFQYDPQSYALNFNDGVDEDDDGSLLGFSARFAGPVPVDDRRATFGS